MLAKYIRLLAFLGGICAAPAAAQQGSIAGRITDKVTQQPIQGAQVLILGTNLQAVTSQDGRYRIDRISAGAYQVQVRRPQDALLQPVENLSNLWRNNAGLSWQPFGMLTLSGDLVSTRDLRDYSDSTALGRLAARGLQDHGGDVASRVSGHRPHQLRPALALGRERRVDRPPRADIEREVSLMEREHQVRVAAHHQAAEADEAARSPEASSETVSGGSATLPSRRA